VLFKSIKVNAPQTTENAAQTLFFSRNTQWQKNAGIGGCIKSILVTTQANIPLKRSQKKTKTQFDSSSSTLGQTPAFSLNAANKQTGAWNRVLFAAN